MCDEITNSFTTCCTVEVWEWISNFTRHYCASKLNHISEKPLILGQSLCDSFTALEANLTNMNGSITWIHFKLIILPQQNKIHHNSMYIYYDRLYMHIAVLSFGKQRLASLWVSLRGNLRLGVAIMASQNENRNQFVIFRIKVWLWWNLSFVNNQNYWFMGDCFMDLIPTILCYLALWLQF